MNAKSKTLIAALAAIVALTGAYFGAEAWRKKKADAERASLPQAETPRLTEFDSALISRIEILSEGIVLEKSGETWRLEAPEISGIEIDQTAVSGKLWSLGNLRAEMVIEEAPSDLSQYGLSAPAGHAVITDSSGKNTELFFGDLTPGRTSYYAMVSGDPKVYTVSSYWAENFMFSVNDIRNKQLLPGFDPAAFTRFTLENPDGVKIDITPKQDGDFKISSFSSFVLNSPFKVPRGADTESLGALAELFKNLAIAEFIDDEPDSLAVYGLDKPGRLYIEAGEIKLDLAFGRDGGGTLYAKFPDRNGVFTVTGLEEVINTKAFNLADKFIMIFHIDSVKDFRVEGEGHNIFAELRGTKDEPEFFVDGRKAADKEFRTYYQAVIGLLVDAGYTGPAGRTAEGEGITITFNFKEPAGTSSVTKLVPYNRDFYSVTQEGLTEFLLSRSQAAAIFDAASKLVYED